jgi:hypothetical protein
MTQDQTTPLRIWKPDVHFSDAQSLTVLGEELDIKNHGVMYWSRHLALTLSQSSFDYSMYPLDKQTLQIRFESYSSPNYLFNLQFSNVTYTSIYGHDPLVLYPPVQLYQDDTATGATPNFKSNPLWLYDNTYSIVVSYPNFASNPALGARLFSQATISLPMIRQNEGLLLRFGLPITGVTCIGKINSFAVQKSVLISPLGGLLFWDTLSSRLTNTITLILTLSAIFIAVFGAIPLVGYPTLLDKFVFAMFAILLVSPLSVPPPVVTESAAVSHLPHLRRDRGP